MFTYVAICFDESNSNIIQSKFMYVLLAFIWVQINVGRDAVGLTFNNLDERLKPAQSMNSFPPRNVRGVYAGQTLCRVTP